MKIGVSGSQNSLRCQDQYEDIFSNLVRSVENGHIYCSPDELPTHSTWTGGGTDVRGDGNGAYLWHVGAGI